uniref:Thyroglobulin n=1 Tax=Denticeps clupeoides TaxID=299321 RepID=A0AAY4CAV8_9TELE
GELWGKMGLVSLAIVLLGGFAVCGGKISEYQLESGSLSQCETLRSAGTAQRHEHVPQCTEDGRFRHVQCSSQKECWCVDATGEEVPGSRRQGPSVHCLTSCQLHRQRVLQSENEVTMVPQCSDVGEYEPIQCDLAAGQCWCVDQEGMEIYGTRQQGRPSFCPGSCEVRERRLLHGVGDPSPPQCSDDGSFLPVQCKFVNTTDRTPFDLLHTFNRFPEMFQSFSGFRMAFPEVSSYCFCVDSRGREMGSTGVELLLNEVYDTAFSGMGPARSLSQSNLYRVLQRRFLAIQLALSGRFRCPTPCESERSAASQAANVFVATCDANGAYAPTQCQSDGQCWCVNSEGKEVFGTRQDGQPSCSESVDCMSERRQALSRLFYGPAGYFSHHNVFSSSPSDPSTLSVCSQEFQELLAKSGLFRFLPESEPADLGDVLAEMVQGMFPSGALALKALALASNPKRLQENLFGGKFLKNAGSFNFSGALGSMGTLDFSQIFSQVGLTEVGGDFQQLAKVFSEESGSGVLMGDLNQDIKDAYGRSVNLKRNQNLIKLVVLTLENELFLSTLREAIGLLKLEDSTQLGPLFQAMFQSSQPGFCGSERPDSLMYVPQCTESGQYQEVQCLGSECWCVDSQGLEVPGSRSQDLKPRCPTQCVKEREVAIRIKASLSAGAKTFIPKCEEDGTYVAMQCQGNNCFCMDQSGVRYSSQIPGTLQQCPTDCQSKASQAFLNAVCSVQSDPSSMTRLSDIYIPQCSDDGRWHQIQCDGPPEQAFEFYREWVRINNNGKDLLVSEFLTILRGYGTSTEARASFSDFLAALFRAGHHKVFPMLAKFAAFTDVPKEVTEGQVDAVFGPSVFLNPLSLWRLLQGNAVMYPGHLSDFSVPLNNFDLRHCWCVGKDGQAVPGTKVLPNETPKCPESCSQAMQELTRFLGEANEYISLSNRSHIPLGYGFLLANSIRLSAKELLQAEAPPTEALLSNSDSALRLAAHSTFNLLASKGQREGVLLGYQPYRPQCDALGQWLPRQCHLSTGHCWCVDEEGRYIPGSLRYRAAPMCQSRCQRAQAQAQLSDWSASTYIPTCEENGDFSVLQAQAIDDSVARCFSPITGNYIQTALQDSAGEYKCPGWCALLSGQVRSRLAGVGYSPDCQEAGSLFSPLQCDQSDCWCVSTDRGLELKGTRIPRSTGRTPSCSSPLCPLPFGVPSIPHGTVVCQSDQQGQLCTLICHEGYISALPTQQFPCDPENKAWLTGLLSNTCQRYQPLQTVRGGAVMQLSLPEGQRPCVSLRSSTFQSSLLRDMRANGLCGLKFPLVGQTTAASLCDESSVSLECVGVDRLTANFTLSAELSALPISVFPDLHDIEVVFSDDRLGKGLLDLMSSEPYQSLVLADSAVIQSAAPTFGCLPGYRKLPDGAGCVVCPAGSSSSADACWPCPQGSYQAEAGQTSCSLCPAGTSTVAQGAFSATHCVTRCQQSGMRCSEKGGFLPAQQDPSSGRWFCVTSEGTVLSWTSAEQPITEQECRVLEKFEAVPESKLVLGASDLVILRSEDTDLPLETHIRKCVSDCAQDESCHHVSVFAQKGQTRCDVYSTDSANVDCKTSQQSGGFLGNPSAELFQSLSCSLKVNVGKKPSLTILRKKTHEFSSVVGQKTFQRPGFRKAGAGVYSTAVFQADGTTVADAHRYCLDACSRETCCDGFIFNQNVLHGGTVMCGFLSHPDTLLCSEDDWDMAGLGPSSRVCGAGLRYNKQRKQFTFSLGGQMFTITDAALPATSKNTTDYQASIISFQNVYLWKDSDMNIRQKDSACAGAPIKSCNLFEDAVGELFGALEHADVRVDAGKDVPSQRYWIFKHQYTPQEVQRYCLQRCEEEEVCHVADLRDEGPLYFLCVLYPDTRVCGAYDKPLRQPCSLLLPRDPQRAHLKKVTLSGSVENFYKRVPFKKMVSYSVRNRVELSSKPITEGFFECERRCDEDPCCRAMGYVRDTSSPGPAVLCLTLNSLGVQTCGEESRSSWRVQDCSPSQVEAQVYPFGWYEKPVNQWTNSPRLCPSFHLSTPSKINMEDWKLLDSSSYLTDVSVSTFDVIHISRDIAGDHARVTAWCLAACEESVSCAAVSLHNRASATRCVLYPDTHTCSPTGHAQDCRLLVREAASQVYLRRGVKPEVTSVPIPDHGLLLGRAAVANVGSEVKAVHQFLGVPYAQPPIAGLRFGPPVPSNWTGSWNGTFARPSCIQPGDVVSGSSEDCLYLDVFVPRSAVTSNTGPGLLDGSHLAAVGNVIVVTAHFRVAAFGFLSSGLASQPGNSGLLDQVAALRWVQEHIGHFGGDPRRVTLGAERNGADVASLHLTSSSSSGLFDRVMLMGGSAFSPATVISNSRAQELSSSLGRELNCPISDPAQLLACLRTAPAPSLNAAQTKLLAVSGPLQAWAPVVDGISVKEPPASAFRASRYHTADLLLGSSTEDGLIGRAKKIKSFEELQGRADSKTAFYQALANSLGGREDNALIKQAATWFYSLQHAPTPSGYNVFSRALENATRDLFIICPVQRMADFWAANTRSNVFVYHLPEDMAQTSADLSLPLDVQLAFGLPHNLLQHELFSSAERTLSLQTMSYLANFIKSGNPNRPVSLSRVSPSTLLPPWPRFLPHPSGDNYKELRPALGNSRGVRRAECSFWNDYVPSLTGRKASGDFPASGTVDSAVPTPKADFRPVVTQSERKSEKDAYN